ncbi:tetratricopeptide repeat protein [Amycolatopsis sp. NPDC049159]|uniref:tetratricopeptide repeat protein n=1 Tax=Amycolatopsis sp. NPDC049159 TaxID=3157210 RepID=UPI0033FC9331
MSVDNTVTGTAGAVVQANSIRGGVHWHVDTPVELPKPRQLPASTRDFVGRAAQLDELNNVLVEDDRPGTVVVSAIDGTAGIGKTTLALTWAHQAADRFPDGQLYVNLRGFEPTAAPMPPEEALRGFLNAFRIPTDTIPADLQALSALYRSLLAGRRLLIVLDNARDSEQVRPLLPGSTSCAVVVTSRNRLTELVVRESARLVTLDMLSADDARELLARQLGDGRVAAEPEAVTSLVRSCAGLPLALTIAAARGATDPRFPLTVLADELQDEQSRLDGLETGDPQTDLESVFSWSYRSLPPSAARVFRCLGAHAGADLGLDAIRALTDGSLAQTRALVAKLVRANLADQYLPGRYRMHDLLRLYARRLATQDDSVALERMYGWYRDRVTAAVSWIHPRLAGDRYFRTCSEAIAWLEAERGNLVAIILDERQPELSVELACLLSPFFRERRNFDDWGRTLTAAYPKAEGDRKVMVGFQLRYMEAVSHTQVDLGDVAATSPPADDGEVLACVARTYLTSGRGSQAKEAATAALALLRAVGDPRAEGWALLVLAEVCTYQLLFDETAAALEQALEIWQRLGDRWFEAETLMRRAKADRKCSQVTHAIECLDRAYSIYDSFGDLTGKAQAICLRGSVLGQYGDARRAYEDQLLAHRFAVDAGDRRLEMQVLEELCLAARRFGKIAACWEYHDRWAAVADALGDPDGPVVASTELGTTYSELGDHARAISLLRELRERARGLRIETEGRTIRALGDACGRQGRVAEAVRCYLELEALYADHGELLEGALQGLCVVYREIGSLADVMACAKRRIEANGNRGDPGSECWALDDLGIASTASGHYQDAISAHARAMELRSVMGMDSYRRGWGFVDIAYVHLAAGRFENALTNLYEARSVRESSANLFGVQQLVGMIAVFHIVRREFDIARSFVEQVIRLSPFVAGPVAEGLREILGCYLSTFRFDEFEMCYLRALPAVRLLGDRTRGMSIRRSAVQARLVAGRSAEALELLRYEIDLAEAATDFTTAASLRTELVVALIGLRRFTDAESEALQGIRAAQRTASEADHVSFLSLCGRIYRKQGRYDEARRILDAGIDICERNGHPAKAELLARLAQTCLEAGAPREAVDAQRSRLDLDRAAGDDRKVAVTLAKLAEAYGVARERDAAERFLDESIVLSRRLEDPRGAAAAFGACARAAQSLELVDQAEEHFIEQEKLSSTVFDLDAQAKSVSDRAEHHRRAGRHARARELHERSLELRRELGDPLGTADQLRQLGVVTAELGLLDEAVGLLTECHTMAGNFGDTARLADARRALATVHARRGDTRQAEQLLARCRTLYERLGAAVELRGLPSTGES